MYHVALIVGTANIDVDGGHNRERGEEHVLQVRAAAAVPSGIAAQIGATTDQQSIYTVPSKPGSSARGKAVALRVT